MESKYLFKVWNVHRTKKVAVVLNSNESNLYEKLILKASEKLSIDGSTIILEEDGTAIDDDEALCMLHKEVFILLQKNELWLRPCDSKNTSLDSTLTSTITEVPSDSTSNISSNFLFKTQETLWSDPENNEMPIIISNEIRDISDNTSLALTSLTNEQMTFTTVSPNVSAATISLTDPNSNLSSSDISEDTWRNFQIPWHKLTKTVLADINDGKRGKKINDDIVHLVADEILEIKQNISSKSLKIIVHKIIDKSPLTFQDRDDDGCVLGDGSHTLFSRLRERISYLNKKTKRKLNEPSDVIRPEKRKKILAARAGCSNWSDETEILTNLDEQIEKLKEVSDDTEMYKLLEATYGSQRKFLNNINNPPTINEIRLSWPMLLKRKAVFWHYNKLMNHSIDNLEIVLKLKYSKILKLPMLKNKWKAKDVCDDVKGCMETLKLIANYFKEDFETLFKTLPDTSDQSLQEVKTASPCVLIVKAQDGNDTFLVSIEKQLIDEETSFFEALKLCYAAYYVFNMQYPARCSALLEFLQRYCLKTHPDQGTKSKKFSVSKKKVISLIQKLSDYDMENKSGKQQ